MPSTADADSQWLERCIQAARGIPSRPRSQPLIPKREQGLISIRSRPISQPLIPERDQVLSSIPSRPRSQCKDCGAALPPERQAQRIERCHVCARREARRREWDAAMY